MTSPPHSTIEVMPGSPRVDGFLAGAAVVVAVLLAVGSSGVFFDLFGWLGLIGGVLVVVTWTFWRMLAALGWGRGAMRHQRSVPNARSVVVALVVPVLATISLVSLGTGTAGQVRFTLSEAALRDTVDHALVGPITTPPDRWDAIQVSGMSPTLVGLYPIDLADRISTDTIVLVVDGGGIWADAGGFAYRAAGVPDIPNAVSIRPIGDGWWVWYEEWD